MKPPSHSSTVQHRDTNKQGPRNWTLASTISDLGATSVPALSSKDNRYPDDVFPRDPKCDLWDELASTLHWVHEGGAQVTDRGSQKWVVGGSGAQVFGWGFRVWRNRIRQVGPTLL